MILLLNLVVIFSSDCYCAFNHIFNGGDHGEVLIISNLLVVGDVEDEDEDWDEDEVGIEQD